MYFDHIIISNRYLFNIDLRERNGLGDGYRIIIGVILTSFYILFIFGPLLLIVTSHINPNLALVTLSIILAFLTIYSIFSFKYIFQSKDDQDIRAVKVVLFLVFLFIVGFFLSFL